MRLIDADKVQEIIDHVRLKYIAYGTKSQTNQFFWDNIRYVEKKVRSIPTVEAKPVVHGGWIYNRYHTWECGNCGFHPFKGYIPKEPGFNFCPNCGADMRKKVNDD